MREFHSMTKDELIVALQDSDCSGDTPVVIGYSSGDYWGQILARPMMDELFETRMIHWSEYHRQWKQPRKPDGDAVTVLVLGLTQDQDQPDEDED